MGLNDLIRGVHGHEELGPALDFFLLNVKEKFRADGWHPSDFCGMCPRERVLKKLVAWPEEGFKIDPKLRRIFDVGTALHKWYQEEYFGPMGILWGKWECSTCRGVHWGFQPGSCECYSDAFCNWVFKEVPFEASIEGCEKKVYGHSDGLIKLSRWAILEIKTINSWGFSKLSEAYPKHVKHVKQGEIYGELTRQRLVPVSEGVDIPRPEDLVVLYINKDNCDLRIFKTPLNEEVGKQELRKPLLYDRAFKDKKLPPRLGVCTNMLKNPAKKCSVGSYCFGDLDWDGLVKIGKDNLGKR